ncbi:ATP-binding cassette domain-containing protein [Paenibacillus zeisoli]|uniref:ATP-binding cassette domain-containing protein n=1 Tax=Paenibacillus zeisoli TaxID=2496267 RepID=A0A3S1D447_9BACL|nr:ATP-binding cassette domain-containing protein [Paenibacillus zeisoli]
MFELRKVRYREVLHVHELNIEAHKVTCILGESGSGKTTLLQLLNEMITPDDGTILYRGRSIAHMDPVLLRRECVMVPQSPVIFSGSIRDNLGMGLKMSARAPATDDEMRESLRAVCLSKELEEAADRLSGGEKQRLCLARALLMSPGVLLLDEPTAALDEATSLEVLTSITGRARAEGISLIIVTHSRSAADLIGENIIYVHQGKIVSREVVSS